MDFSGRNNPNFKHGLTDGNKFRHPVYTAWQNMKQRCFNEKHPKYQRYGARGITVCNEWMKSKTFIEWAFANGWQKGLTLDRKNNDEGYEPSNCEWILLSLNSRKKSTTKLTIDQAMNIKERCSKGENEQDIASEFNVSHGTVWFIVNNLTWK